ncbi:MAG: DUF5611 family protein [Thermoplasmata archaeon]
MLEKGVVFMQVLDIKKGNFSKIDGGKLKEKMKEIFGNVKEEDGFLVSYYLAMDPIRLKIQDKTHLICDIVTKTGLSEEDNIKTISAKNKVLEFATGFTAKERAKRLQKAAKDGKI